MSRKSFLFGLLSGLALGILLMMFLVTGRTPSELEPPHKIIPVTVSMVQESDDKDSGHGSRVWDSPSLQHDSELDTVGDRIDQFGQQELLRRRQSNPWQVDERGSNPWQSDQRDPLNSFEFNGRTVYIIPLAQRETLSAR